MTLVIMAAGMGSRFGGLKQIEPIDEYGNFIIDYSIYDAIKVGFTKVVFIIKKENYDIFRETVGKRIEDKIKKNIQAEYSKKNGIDKEKWSESFIKSQYVLNNRSCCLDSEFAYKNDNYDIRIDIVKCVDGEIKFVEIKRLDDNRMLKIDDASPEVISQMNDYKEFIHANKKDILEYYQKLWKIKNNLGLLPKSMICPTKVNEVPELYIFNRWEKPHIKRDNRKERIEKILQREKISFTINSEF